MTRSERLKMLRMRSWRRGIREMDLILGPFADRSLERMDDETLDLYQRLLEENDQDLYRWATDATPPPAHYAALISGILGDREDMPGTEC